MSNFSFYFLSKASIFSYILPSPCWKTSKELRVLWAYFPLIDEELVVKLSKRDLSLSEFHYLLLPVEKNKNWDSKIQQKSIEMDVSKGTIKLFEVKLYNWYFLENLGNLDIINIRIKCSLEWKFSTASLHKTLREKKSFTGNSAEIFSFLCNFFLSFLFVTIFFCSILLIRSFSLQFSTPIIREE